MTWRWIYIYFDNHNIKKLWHMCVKDYFCSYIVIDVNMASRFLLCFTKFSRLNSYYSSLLSQLTFSWHTKYINKTNKTNIRFPFLENFALVKIGTQQFYILRWQKTLKWLIWKTAPDVLKCYGTFSHYEKETNKQVVFESNYIFLRRS